MRNNLRLLPMKQPRNSDEVVEWPDDEEPLLDLVQALERLTLSDSLYLNPEDNTHEE